jgi:L-ascorbate metabolism protein UlaG (beta-lactamase superfamily)
MSLGRGRRALLDRRRKQECGGEAEPLAFTPTSLPSLAAVLASHRHYDHHDLAAFAAYPDKTVPTVVKRGMGARARQAGFTDVREVEPWEQVQLRPVQITAAPAKHGVPPPARCGIGCC